MPAGRPTDYEPEYAVQAEKLCLLGATDSELADFFEVATRTIYRWQVQFPEFSQALKDGKQQANDRVRRSLYHKAIGYSHESVKIFMPSGAVEPVYAPYTEHTAPDTTAAIFWLKNREPGLWRDRVQQEISGPDGKPIEMKSVSDKDRAKAIASLVSRLRKSNG